MRKTGTCTGICNVPRTVPKSTGTRLPVHISDKKGMNFAERIHFICFSTFNIWEKYMWFIIICVSEDNGFLEKKLFCSYKKLFGQNRTIFMQFSLWTATTCIIVHHSIKS